MPHVRNDGLLVTVKVLLQILSALTAIGAVAFLAGVGAVLTGSASEITKALAGAPPEAVSWLAGICALASVMLMLSLFFLFQLIRIVNSVGEGDPFRPDNATYLTRMAWLALAVQLVSAAIAPLTFLLSQHIDDVNVEGGLSLNGVALVLVLFILARVFRKGTEMREELEGTV
jgi:hypothetical protein